MFKAISFTIVATLLGQVLNFSTDILIANYFGTSWKADSYILALLFPMIVYDLYIAGISATFIPLYINRQKAGDAQSFFSTVVSTTVLSTLFIGLLLFILAPYLVELIAIGFSQEAKRLTVILTRLLLFLVVTTSLSTVLSNLLNAYNQFAIPALGKAINFACIILSMTFLVKTIGIYSLVLGFFVGSLLFLTVQIFLTLKTKVKYSLILQIKHPALKEMGILLLPLLLATLVNYVNIFVERSVAASFEEGSIAALNYAFKIINIPVNLLIIAAMTVIMPTFSRHAAEGDKEGLRELTLKGLKVTSFIITPIISGIIIFRIPLIKLLFERGEFTTESTAVTASALLFYACGIFGLSAVTLLTRVFYAIKDIKTLSQISVIIIIFNIISITILSKILGFVGIPLTFSITYTIYTITMLIILTKKHHIRLTIPFLKSSAKHVFTSAIIAISYLPLVSVMDYPFFSSTFGKLSYLLLAAVFGIIIYTLVSSLLRVEEISFVFEKAKTLKYKIFPNQKI